MRLPPEAAVVADLETQRRNASAIRLITSQPSGAATPRFFDRSSRRRRGKAFDEQPQRDRNLERGHRYPHELSDGAAQDACELQRKPHDKQDRRKHADPGQRDGDHPAAQEEPGEEGAPHGEECRADDSPALSRKKERAEGLGCLGRALRLLAIGSLAGLLLGIAATRVLSAVVYQATPRDPLVLAGVVLVMSVLGLLATSIPAQRALLVDPSILLREE